MDFEIVYKPRIFLRFNFNLILQYRAINKIPYKQEKYIMMSKFLQELSNQKNETKNSATYNIWSRHNQNSDIYQQKNPEINNFKENFEDPQKREINIEPRYSSTRALPVTNHSISANPSI